MAAQEIADILFFISLKIQLSHRLPKFQTYHMSHGHGWFRRHRSKIDEDSKLCRFCRYALEDPEHLWSSCRTFDGVRHAIKQECKEDNRTVSFSKPFVWSVTQLIRFFRDPNMAELLTGPGTQQQPL